MSEVGTVRQNDIFVDDVMFLYHGASGPESSMTLRVEVRQVAVSAGCQTSTVFG